MKERRKVWSYRDKWTELYGLLVFAATEGHATVDVHRLSELQGWSDQQVESIGKIVSRHLKRTAGRGLQLIESTAVTKTWRLGVEDVAIVPTESNLQMWLKEKGLGRPPRALQIDWIQCVTRALISFQRGELDDATQNATAAFEIPQLDLKRSRIAALILYRIAASQGRLDDEEERIQPILAKSIGANAEDPTSVWGVTPLGVHIRSRVLAMKVIGSDAVSAKDQIDLVTRQLHRCKETDDLASEAVLRNVLGLLALRKGAYDVANYNLNEAIILASTIGDLFTLGGGVFNLGLAMLRESGGADMETARRAKDLVILSTELDRRLSFGRNSAQAQTLISRICVALDEMNEASSALAEAKKIVARNQNPYDIGCLAEAEARFVWAKVGRGEIEETVGRQEVQRLLQLAVSSFGQAGFLAARRVRDDLRRFAVGGELSLTSI